MNRPLHNPRLEAIGFWLIDISAVAVGFNIVMNEKANALIFFGTGSIGRLLVRLYGKTKEV